MNPAVCFYARLIRSTVDVKKYVLTRWFWQAAGNVGKCMPAYFTVYLLLKVFDTFNSFLARAIEGLVATQLFFSKHLGCRPIFGK